MSGFKRLMLVALAAMTLVAAAAPAGALPKGKAEVTKGSFTTLPGGTDLGYDIRGKATMVRLGGGTFVSLNVRGLDADTAYPVHVHNAPCSNSPAGGGHYQHVDGGAIDDVNEIWPGFTTNAAGNGHGRAWHGNKARPDAMSIVIHYPPDKSIRLACVDLS